MGLGLEDSPLFPRRAKQPYAVQVAIYDWSYKAHTSSVRLFHRGPDEAVVPVNNWFTVEVMVRGNKFSSNINGKLISEASDPERRYDRGHIGFVAMQGSRLAIRRVEIREVPHSEQIMANAEFAFQGVWLCRHITGWTGKRTVMQDRVIDANGKECRWKQTDGQLVVRWPEGGWEHLVIDMRNPDQLSGQNGAGMETTWVRQE